MEMDPGESCIDENIGWAADEGLWGGGEVGRRVVGEVKMWGGGEVER